MAYKMKCKRKGNGAPKGAFVAKFTGKVPCFKCQKLVEKGQFARMDFSTGTKQVIHHECKDLAVDLRLPMPDWPPTAEQQEILDVVTGYLQWAAGITTLDTWNVSQRIREILNKYVSDASLAKVVAGTNGSLHPLRAKIEALAGSGKTSTLKLVLASIQDQYPPDGPFALYLVFNTRNAAEASIDIPPTVAWSKTLHSFGLHQVKEAMSKDPAFPGYVKIEKRKLEFLYKDLINDWGDLYGEDREQEIARYAKMSKLIGHAKNRCLDPTTLPDHAQDISDFFELFLPRPDDDPAFMTDVTTLFTASIEDKFRVDFDDMLYFLWKYKIKLSIPRTIKFVLVDEFQDQNALRIWLVAELASMGYHVIVVGDRNQAIMGFSGAMTDAMDQADLALGEYTISLPLTTCLRCKNLHIIDHVREHFVPNIQAAPDAEYLEPIQHFGPDQLAEVITQLGPGDAVISRVNAPNIQMYFELLGLRKMSTILGTDYIEKLHQLFEKLEKDYGASTPEEFYAASQIWFDTMKEKFKRKPWKLADLEDHATSIQAICGNMEEGDDLTQIKQTLDTMFSDSGPGKSASLITLTSAHKSKGLEWRRVFVLEAVNGKSMFPHPYVTNEELVMQELNLLGSVASLRGTEFLAYFQGVFEYESR